MSAKLLDHKYHLLGLLRKRKEAAETPQLGSPGVGKMTIFTLPLPFRKSPVLGTGTNLSHLYQPCPQLRSIVDASSFCIKA